MEDHNMPTRKFNFLEIVKIQEIEFNFVIGEYFL
jgi:hypothetical protein